MAAANNEFFEALSMLEHERGITAEYLIEKIKAAIIIAVKKNYEVEEDHVKVDIDPAAGRFDVALIQDVVADEDWYDEHSEIGITEAQKIRKTYEVGDRIITPLKTKDFGRIAAQIAKALKLDVSAISAGTAWWLFPTYYVRELYGIVYQTL